MKRYLIDENLPAKLGFINDANYLHVKSFVERLSDNDIWELALKDGLTILTQDTDFLERIKFSNSAPKLIHIKIGNMRLQDFHSFMQTHWHEIVKLSDENKLVIVYLDRIEFSN